MNAKSPAFRRAYARRVGPVRFRAGQRRQRRAVRTILSGATARREKGLARGQRRYEHQVRAQRKAKARRVRAAAGRNFRPGLPLAGLPVFRRAGKRARREFYREVQSLPHPVQPRIGQTRQGPVVKNVGELAREFNLPRAQVVPFLRDVGDKRVAGALRKAEPQQRAYLRQRRSYQASLPHGFQHAAPGPKAKSPLQAGVSAGLENVFGPAAALVETTASHPGQVASASLRSGKESITGIPQGVKMLVDNPGGALHAIAKDYERRYGPLLKGDNATFSHRLRHDYGLTPYALDAAATVGGFGTAAGKALDTTAAGRLAAKAAEAKVPLGRSLHAAHRMMREERPALRISGGEAGTVPQRASKNVLVRAGQRRLDVARERKYARTVEAHGATVVRQSTAESDRLARHAIEHMGGRANEHGQVLVPHSEMTTATADQMEQVAHRFERRADEAQHAGRKGDARRYKQWAAQAHQHVEQARREGRPIHVEVPMDRPVSRQEVISDMAGRRVEGQPATSRLERLPGREQTRFDALRPGEGEVLPYYSAREQPVLRRLMGRTERAHGARKGQERLRLLTVGGQVERKARKAIRQLNGDEKDALMYAMEFGLSPEHKGKAVAALKRYEQMVKEGRKGEGEVLPFEPDELPTIRKIIANPDAHITPKLREVADELRALERDQAAKDPGLVREQAGARRILPQSMLLGERRRPDVQEFHGRLRDLQAKLEEQGKAPGDLVAAFGHVGEHEPKARQAVVKDLERALRVNRGKADRTLRTAERRAARVEGKAAGRNKPIRTESVRRAERELNDAQGEVVRLERRRRGQAVPEELQRARTREAAARALLREEVSHAPRVSEALRVKVRKAQEDVISRRAARDDAQIVHEVSARLRKDLKHRPGKYEPFDVWAHRVERAAEEAGLEAPSYFESTGGAELRRSLHAIGTGVRGAARSKEYTGARFLAGRQSGDPEVIVNGLLRNAKRRFSWRFVVNSMRQSAFEWSRGAHGGGLTARELNREFDRRLIDPDTVELVNVRTLEDRELQAEGLSRGQVVDPEALASPTGGVHPEDLTGLHEGIRASTVPWDDVQRDVTAGDVRGQGMNRYLVVPRRDYDELAAATRPDGVVGRGIDILLRQKPARILLGLANVSWLGFQVMSNMSLAGLGRSLNPFDYVGAQLWWRKLTPEQRLAIEPELGITHHHHFIGQETHLGAATNNRFVNAYRAFKQTKVMRLAKKGNPLDAMFRVDEAQNNMFRRTMLYTQARRDAYRRMGQTWKDLPRVQGEIVRLLDRKSHADKVRAIIDDHALFEQHARHVNEWLGDYLTYSSAERRNVFLRSTMFYGYLRFSLRMAFWTMPVKHPIMADLLSNVGRMGSQEIKRLLGLPAEPDGYRSGDLPPWMLAQVYYGTPAAIRGEKPGAGTVNLGRMNPFMNTLTQTERPSQVLGLFSPLFQAELDQIFTQSTYRGKTWRILGKPTPGEAERPANYFGSWFQQVEFGAPKVGPFPGWKGSPRGRILERQLLDLAVPMRLWEQARFRGTQSDDALPWDPRAIVYKDKQAAAHQAQTAKRQGAEGAWGAIIRQLVPLLGPAPTSAPGLLKREREKTAALKHRGRKKKNRSSSPWGGSGGGSAPWRGSSGKPPWEQ